MARLERKNQPRIVAGRKARPAETSKNELYGIAEQFESRSVWSRSKGRTDPALASATIEEP